MYILCCRCECCESDKPLDQSLLDNAEPHSIEDPQTLVKNPVNEAWKHDLEVKK